jgi:spore coat protein A
VPDSNRIYYVITYSTENGPCFSIPGTGTHYCTNEQSAWLVWYHDHAIGITRLNASAGIASAYIITDDFEAKLVSSGLLPNLVGIPLVIQDKSFVARTSSSRTRPDSGRSGRSLESPRVRGEYPHRRHSKSEGQVGLGRTFTPPETGTSPLPTPASLVPEAFFDTPLINGGIYPHVSVPPKRVRFRLLNGSQARFYHLNLYPENGSNSGEAKVGTPSPTPPRCLIESA